MGLDIDTAIDGPLPPNGGRTVVEVTVDPVTKTRPTTRHVVLLVDTSFSMSDGKIERARGGVDLVLDELNGDDLVSIVSFTSRSSVVLSMTRWEEADEESIRASVTGTANAEEYDGELIASGGTDILDALETAEEQFDGSGTSGTVSKEIILLSDGKDSHDVEEYERIASDLAESGVSVIAGGIGNQYNEEVMLALGRESGGESYDLSDSDQIELFLQERIREAEKVVSSNPNVEITMGDGFMLDDSDVYFIEPQTQRRTIERTSDGGTFDIPRLTGDRRQRFSFEVLGTPKPTGPEYHVLDLSIVGDEPLASASVSVRYGDTEEPSKTTVERRREVAKAAYAITDPGADESKVRSAIDEIEDRGWTKEARKLRKELDEGGGIETSKAFVGDE